MYLKLSQYSQENTCTAGLKARSFPVNIAKSFKNCFLKKHFRWLLYSDTIYDQTYNSIFQTKYLNLYSLMIYLAIIGAVRGTSSGKLYHELQRKYFQFRCKYRKSCCLFKKNKQLPQFFDLITKPKPRIKIRYSWFDKIISKTFFSFAVIRQHSLEFPIKHAQSYSVSKNNILEFLSPSRAVARIF